MESRYESLIKVFPVLTSDKCSLDWAKNAEEAIRLLDEREKYNVALLDHDLSSEHYKGETKLNPTGVAVAKHMAGMSDEDFPDLVVVHSWNQDGAMSMLRELERRSYKSVAAPYGTVGFTRIMVQMEDIASKE